MRSKTNIPVLRIFQWIHQRIQGAPRSLGELNYSLQLLSNLRTLGWHRSVRHGTSLGPDGSPLPWYTYPAIQWLTDRLGPDDRVFEFGAGHSTLWFSRLVHHVVSVEHTEAWFKRLQDRVGSNVTLSLRQSSGNPAEGDEQSEYCNAIDHYPEGSFDIIAIDGVERVSCVYGAVRRLKNDGIIIFDNSDRPRFQRGIEYLREAGFERLDFYGFIPACGTLECTSVFGRFPSRWSSAKAPISFRPYLPAVEALE